MSVCGRGLLGEFGCGTGFPVLGDVCVEGDTCSCVSVFVEGACWCLVSVWGGGGLLVLGECVEGACWC